jgi:ubiquitin C-terminal hydrolase
MHGLPNLGATCYLNTSIQCLMFSKNFYKFIEKNNNLYNLLDIYPMKDLKDYINFCKLLQGKIDFININYFNDIHEFLTFFIDKLKDDTIKKGKEVEIKKDSMYSMMKYKYDKFWYDRNDYSDLMNLLYIENIIQTECGHCNKIWQNYEMNTMLELDIIEKDNLIDAIKRYSESVKVNEWKCDKCEMKHDNSEKKGIFWKLPKLLMICLKRFKHNNGTLQKLNYEFDYPLNLNLTDFVLKKGDYKYNLIAVANHFGDHNHGHYTSTLINNMIFTVDDSKIIKANSLNKQNAYVLFYEKITE